MPPEMDSPESTFDPARRKAETRFVPSSGQFPADETTQRIDLKAAAAAAGEEAGGAPTVLPRRGGESSTFIVFGDEEEAPAEAPLAPGDATDLEEAGRVLLHQQVICYGRDPAAAQAHYILRDILGEGGMGIVYQAFQVSLDRTVALKMLKQEHLFDTEARTSFLAEAVVTGALAHPNIMPVYDVGLNEKGMPFFAMKEVKGESWFDAMPDLSRQENLDILMRVADAIAFAHDKGVIHRDLKPANVMLGAFGEVLVTDWGMAVGTRPASKAPRLSPNSAIAGTPEYMAPEVARGLVKAIGVWSDIYLLGAMLFEIITGYPPHGGEDPEAVLRNATRNVLRPVEDTGMLVDIALNALATQPPERYRTVRDFQAAIREYQEHEESIVLTARAAGELRRAVFSQNYQEFNRALWSYDEALAQWPGNPEAQRQRLEAARAYAESAIRKGDYDLAAQLLIDYDLTDSPLAQQVADLRGERERLSREKQALEQRFETEGRRRWLTVFEEDCAASETLARLEERWRVVGQPPERLGTELRIAGGKPQGLILKRPVGGDLLLEVICRVMDPRFLEIGCFLAARDGEDPTEIWSSGYEVRYGGFSNSRVSIYRAGQLLWSRNDQPLEAERRYHLRFERIGSHLRLEIDEREIFDLEDEAPLTGADRTVLGVHGYKTDIRYRLIKVHQLGLPVKADLFDTAERHLLLGHYNTAHDLFQEIAELSGDPARAERAREGMARTLHLKALHFKRPADA